MNFLRKLFFPGSSSRDRYYSLTVQCNRCGEIIHGRVDMHSELSMEYTEDANSYYCRKVLMGKGRCFQQIEVMLTFNADRKLLDQQITGGKFVEG